MHDRVSARLLASVLCPSFRALERETQLRSQAQPMPTHLCSAQASSFTHCAYGSYEHPLWNVSSLIPAPVHVLGPAWDTDLAAAPGPSDVTVIGLGIYVMFLVFPPSPRTGASSVHHTFPPDTWWILTRLLSSREQVTQRWPSTGIRENTSVWNSVPEPRPHAWHFAVKNPSFALISHRC